MKIITILSILLFNILQAGLFEKDVTFKYNDSKMERKFPTNKEYLLSYNNVLEEVRTSVVNISTKRSIKTDGNYANPLLNDPFFKDFFRRFGTPQFNIPQERIESSLGSGVIVTSDGYIVTNNHVIDGADQIKVSILGSKKEYDAKIIGTDSKSDLAIIKIDAKKLNAISFYNSDEVKLGDIVFALGNPFGVGQTITQGIVSATGRSSVGITEYENFIQTDAPINPGNSGGALINSAGHLIGINSAIISKSGGNVGIGFAIPSNMVNKISKILINDGEFSRAYLGVTISDITEDISSFYGTRDGAIITGVQKNTPADKIGLKRGDLIISINNQPVKSANELRNIIGTYKSNSKVIIQYVRNKTIYKKELTLSNMKNINAKNGYSFEYEGMLIEPLVPDIKKANAIPNNINGVIIKNIKTKSKAEELGLKIGDVIIQVENIEIETLENFKNAVQGFGKKRMYIYRKGLILVTVI